MKADVTFNQLYYNPSLMHFFFRDQAKRTMERMFQTLDFMETQQIIADIDDFCDDNEISLDDLEELFYSETSEDIAIYFGFEIPKDEDEEEDQTEEFNEVKPIGYLEERTFTDWCRY